MYTYRQPHLLDPNLCVDLVTTSWRLRLVLFWLSDRQTDFIIFPLLLIALFRTISGKNDNRLLTNFQALKWKKCILIFWWIIKTLKIIILSRWIGQSNNRTDRKEEIYLNYILIIICRSVLCFAKYNHTKAVISWHAEIEDSKLKL